MVIWLKNNIDCKIAVLLLLSILSSCKQEVENKSNYIEKIESKELKAILDTSKVTGVILIYDAKANRYYSNDFNEAEKGTLPSSTYKIPNTIIGLETNLLRDKNSIFKWSGEKRAYAIWEKDLSLKQAFQKSCVPCYQELAVKIGAKRMNDYLKKINFGQMKVNDKNINNFWLTGQSKINPFQQVDFLKRLRNKELPISKSTYKTITDILIIEQNENFVLSGKTGFVNLTESKIGWFVGYWEKGENTYYFATRISPKEKDMPLRQFLSLRKAVTILALNSVATEVLR